MTTPRDTIAEELARTMYELGRTKAALAFTADDLARARERVAELEAHLEAVHANYELRRKPEREGEQP